MTNDFREKLFKVTVTLATGAFAATAKSFFSDDLWSVFSGLAVNYASQFSAEVFMPYIKKSWLDHPEKVVNHHIQKALHHSVQTALIEVEAEYFSLDGVSPREQQSLRDFFSILRSRSEREYLDATRDDLESTEVYDYIYHPNDALAHLSDRLRITLDPQSDEYYFTARFIDVFPTRLAEKVQFHFREQLKKGDEAKQALDILFFETLNSGLASLQADHKEIRDTLDQVLLAERQTLERIDFFGEIWISAIWRNREQYDRIEQATIEILGKVHETGTEISHIKRQVESLLRQSVQPGLLHSGRFSDLMMAVSEAQRGYDAAEQDATKAQESLADLEGAASGSSDLTEMLARPLESAREELYRCQRLVLSAVADRERARQELNEFLEAVSATQKQIMSATSHRADEARRFFKAGDFAMADQSLDPRELQRDKAYLLQQRDVVRQELQTLSEDFILKAKLCILNKESDWYEIAHLYFHEAIASFESTNTCFAFAHFLERHNQHADSIYYYERALWLDSEDANRESILNNLGNLYHGTGRYSEAEAAYMKALKIYRKLCVASPQAYQPDVAIMLNNLSVHYRDTGRYSEAEATYSEALEIYRKLSEASPKGYEPAVATTLTNLGNLYYDTGRYSGAEAAYSEALKIRRKLSETSPTAYQPAVAMTLTNLGVLYSDTGRYSEAEAAYGEALEIYRKLSKEFPRVYQPVVAVTLNNLGVYYRDTGQHSEAEAAHREVLEIRRKLSKESPQVYQPVVATTLTNLGVLYRDTGRLSEAEAAYGEALEIRRKLSKESPQVYQPDVATTLTNLGVLYSDIGRYSEAEAAYGEALEIRRKLSKESPQVYQSDVATTLTNLGVLYRDMGKLSEAEAAYKEALKIRRKLSKGSPQVYQPDVATTLTNLGVLYRYMGRYSEAEAAYGEVLKIRRKLSKGSPQVYEPDIARTLNNVGVLYRYMGRYSEAEAAYGEALKIRRELSKGSPQVYEPDIARTLNNLSDLYRAMGRLSEAEAVYKEAQEIRRTV